MDASTSSSSSHDFDFFHGRWQASHRRLRERLAGCRDWDTFTGTCAVQPILGGAGNIDDNVLELSGGRYRAATIRAFDESSRRWSIWWLDGRFPHGPIDPPMVGAFEDGVGLFFADETIGGRAVKVRFRWTRAADGSPQWEQAFSTDGGDSWEINWTTVFTPEPASR